MKKLLIALTTLSSITVSSYAAATYNEITLTSDGLNVDAATYDNSSISATVATGVSTTINFNEQLTLVGATDSTTANTPAFKLSTGDTTATINVNTNIVANNNGASTTIDAHNFEDIAFLLIGRYIFNVNKSATLTVDGNLIADSYGAPSLADLNIDGSLNITNGGFYTSAHLFLNGSITANTFTIADAKSNKNATPTVTATINDGAVLNIADNTINFTGHSYEGAYGVTIGLSVLDNDALKNITLQTPTTYNFNANNPPEVYINFTSTANSSSSEILSAKGDISLGKFTMNRIRKFTITLDSADVTKVIIEDFLFNDTGYANGIDATNKASLIINNFDESSVIDFSDDTIEILEQDGISYLVVDGKYINLSVYDSESALISGLTVVDGILTTVPEPSTYAMIFGGIALGLAVYRRRK